MFETCDKVWFEQLKWKITREVILLGKNEEKAKRIIIFATNNYTEQFGVRKKRKCNLAPPLFAE